MVWYAVMMYFVILSVQTIQPRNLPLVYYAMVMQYKLVLDYFVFFCFSLKNERCRELQLHNSLFKITIMPISFIFNNIKRGLNSDETNS